MDLRKTKNSASIATAGLVLCAMLVLAVGMYKVMKPSGTTADPVSANTSSIKIDAAVEEGPLPGYTASTYKNDEDIFSYRICQKPYFKKGKAEGDICVENPAENQYLMSVDIELEDGTLVYTSDLIRPNQHIQSATLRRELTKGTYPATAIIYAWSQDGEEVLGELEQELTIYVGQKPA